MPTINNNQSVKKTPALCCVPKVTYKNESIYGDPNLMDNVFTAVETMKFENVVIKSGAKLTFHAGDEIVLGAGTIIESGSDVTFSINVCEDFQPSPCDPYGLYSYRKRNENEAIPRGIYIAQFKSDQKTEVKKVLKL